MWGDVLNEFLATAHKADGTLQSSIVDTAAIENGAVTSQKLSTAVRDSLDKADTALQTAPVTSVAGKTGAVTLAKGDVGLGNVDNISDADKPISTATQTALNLKANTADLASVATSGSYNDLSDTPSIPTVTSVAGRTGDVTLTKTDVGLANVDNTSDASKPISSATQTALNGKEATIDAGTTEQYYRGDKSWQTLDKAAVGLENVDNTSDADKPISTATQTALDAKADTADLGTKVLLIDDAESLPSGTPAGVVVVVKA